MSQIESKYSKYLKPLTDDERQQVMKTGFMLIAASLVFMVVFFVLVHTDVIKLYPSSMNEEIVKEFSGRVQYALRYQTLLVAWLLFNVLATIYGRITLRAINPLDEIAEKHVVAYKCILTNSFEQILISVFAQLIFVSFAAPATVLRFIPLVNIIQFIGRIVFFIGYPYKRAFGFHCTILPSIVLVFYIIVKFLGFVGNF